MKRVIKATQSICAMSIINPQLCKQLSIQIELEQRDEGPIPHLHVYHDKTRNPRNCSFVRLDRAEYAPHHKVVPLPKAKKREFIQVMETLIPKLLTVSVINGEFKVANGYQAAVEIWKDTFGETVPFEYDDEGFPMMPDYSSL